MTPRIKVTSRTFCQKPKLRQELECHFSDVTYNESGEFFTPSGLLHFLEDADAVLLGTEMMDRPILSQLPKLKMISKYGVGLDNLDVTAAKELGKDIGWTGGVNRRSVAEQTLGFMIGLCRNLFLTSQQLSTGHWNKNGGISLSGRTVGIVGCGYIGTELLHLLKPFECRLLICDVLDKSDIAKEFGASQVDFSELLQQSDLVTLHVPLDDTTRHMMDAESLGVMKSSAFLINTCRGGVVQQADLKRALQEKQIAGAAIDVYESEPPTDLELLGLPNLVNTPHIGGNAEEAVLAMGRSAISHLVAHFSSGSL